MGQGFVFTSHFLMEVVSSKHAPLPPAVGATPPTRSDARPGCPADPTPSPCVLPCRVLGADATPRCPCGGHLLAPASGGLCWHSGQRGLAVANRGGLKICSLNRNETSIGHLALARPVLSPHRPVFYFSSAALLQRKWGDYPPDGIICQSPEARSWEQVQGSNHPGARLAGMWVRFAGQRHLFPLLGCQ